jgi:flagellar protein FlaG
MGINTVKGAAMTYQGSVSTAEVTDEKRPKVEQSEIQTVSETTAEATTAPDIRQTSDEDGGDAGQQNQTYQNSQIKKAVEDINKKANSTEAIFGIHEATNRVTIKIVDKDTKKVIRELPPEKTLDMIAKVWELAGILVDEKR